MSRKLQNYLRTYRKRYGLSQKDLAFLLGVKDWAKIPKYEKFQHLPNLKTVLACQALFSVPVAELFAGIYEQVEKETSKRAGILQRKMQNTKSNRVNTRKAEFLRAVEVTPDINRENP
jgi:DNA-binding XRE family transcriptional regulator